MEPKMIKEEAIERDSGILTDETGINNNNNKESAFRIHIRKYIFKFISHYVAVLSIIIISLI